MDRIYDQFNRYSLASIDINPYAAVCNQRSPSLTLLQQYFRPFRQPGQPFHIGGTIFENNDLPVGKYIVTDDLHITPGAKLTLAPGTTFEFMGGIGMLVQGELLRTETSSSPLQPILFTSKPLGQPPRSGSIRLVDEFGSDRVLAGRLEVRLGTTDNDNEQWGTVCNRSWTVQHAQLACNQLGLILDPEHFENWRTFPLAEPDERPIIMDNIRCEEREFDLTKCRHDGNLHNVKASCKSTEVVGLRCAPPYWAGVRYSLLANPMSYTGLSTMSNWIIQRAGLFDFRLPLLSPALQIDWNYHTFHSLTIRDNYFDGIDIVYNDLTRKPALRNCNIVRNRRNGMVVRSMGLSAEKLSIQQNGNAGVRYLPRISTSLQRDIVSWLDRREQPELEANGIFIIPNYHLKRIQLFESQLEQRKFLVSKPTEDCSINEQCNFEIELEAIGNQYGMPAKLVVQLINRPNNESDEDAILEDRQTGNKWSARHNTFNFPLVSFGPKMRLTYKRSKGKYSLVLLVLFLDHQEYLDRFLHVYDSIISENQYAVSAVHHSNLTLIDYSAIVNRYAQEKLWFQRVNFTGNIDSVLWVHSPEYNVIKGTPLAEITWHIDNCSVTDNKGPIVDTHRDLYSSANIFHWNFWSNTFANNTGAAIFVHLPDLWDLRSVKKHSFWLTENRFESNLNFAVHLSGYYTFANISSNNFTDNFAPKDLGIVQLLGMEKKLIMERNRFFTNWGAWIVRYEAYSQALFSEEVPAFIQYNYFQFNRFLRPSDEYAEMWPRSYCVGIFGTQRVEIHFNRLRNVLLDFELVAGCKPQLIASDIDVLNVTHNWWGVANEAELSQRVFDSDDWNSLSLAQFSPFYTTEELFLNFWWDYRRAQLNFASKQGTFDPPAHDLRGRLWGHVKLELDPERWYPFPYHYRPFRPYRITRDLTIMPGASLTIEKNVEVHIWPNVRILVYGDLIADGTLWQPVRFRPINTTEYSEQQGKRGSNYRRRRSTIFTPFDLVRAKHFSRGGRSKHLDIEWIFLKQQNINNRKVYRKRKAINQEASNNVWPSISAFATKPSQSEDTFRQFPELVRENAQFQHLKVLLMEDDVKGKLKGFLHFYNATSGETVPSCDRHFTIRNAQVVCRELGFSPQNAYHWLTPQWSYNPKIRIVKTYMEPRECRGFEHRLEQCTLRLTSLLTDWQCMDNEHFNYIHCGQDSSLSNEFIGHWGGITFARYGLDIGEEKERKEEGNNGYEKEIGSGGDRSILRHVELVGGGRAHNNSLFEAALQIIQRCPIMENVNVTNSSMGAMQVLLPPCGNLLLTRLNISCNHGIGLTILSAGLLHSTTTHHYSGRPNRGMPSLSILQSQHFIPKGPLNIPYQIPGFLDICSSGKEIKIKTRLILFYKYDSFAVDCVKIFKSVDGRNLGFRFLQANFYSGPVVIPRSDKLSIYSGSSFSSSSLLRSFNYLSNFDESGSITTRSSIISIHLRATAADGEFGFLAEIATLPAVPLPRKGVDEVAIRASRILNNDRGAINYKNLGEIGPNVIIEQCAIDRNGYHLYGNISTSTAAVNMDVHNTLLFFFRANSIRYGRGGLFISAKSSSSMSRLRAVIKNNAILMNSNSSILTFIGNGLQKVDFLANLISLNYALYADTAKIIIFNFLINYILGFFKRCFGQFLSQYN
uniref:SRCR domain-containing protein n=1 Tax=Meloidogyne enterolobii TaxID=390850 RepID=A0A6V7VHF1_MELEN|nr:unnamed protein product [Meloidogyne enterolobii]